MCEVTTFNIGTKRIALVIFFFPDLPQKFLKFQHRSLSMKSLLVKEDLEEEMLYFFVCLFYSPPPPTDALGISQAPMIS